MNNSEQKMYAQNLGERLAKLLKERRLNEHKLAQQIQEKYGHDMYKTIRRIVRGEGHAPQKQTLKYIADELGVTPTYLEWGEQEAPVLSRDKENLIQDIDRVGSLLMYAPEKSSTIFNDLVEQLVNTLQQGVNLIALVGASGVGKTRVAAKLFEDSTIPNLLPVWFEHNDIEELFKDINKVKTRFPDKSICLIVDEKYQHPIRDKIFFEKFLASYALSTIRTQFPVVLVLRTSTYASLTEENYLKADYSIIVSCDAKRLDQAGSWGLSRQLTKDERKWIQGIASDDKENLITLLVDRVCIPHIKAGRPLDTVYFRKETSILDIIYQGLVTPQSPERRELMKIIYLLWRSAESIPLWLITASWWATGKEITPDAVDAELNCLLRDGLLVYQEMVLGKRIYSWQLFHDLLSDCLEDHIERFERKKYAPIDWSILEKSAEVLIRKEIKGNLNNFAEALALWTAFFTSKKMSNIKIVTALSDSAGDIANDIISKKEIIALISKAALHVRFRYVTKEASSNRSMLDDLLILADIIARNTTAELTIDICRDSLIVTSLAHMMVRCGYVCGLFSRNISWEAIESTIIPINKIGQICTELDIENAFNRLHDFISRKRYIQLLMWARRWDEAGAALERAISESIRADEEEPCLGIAQTDLAACSYVEGGHIREAAGVYERSVELARSAEGLNHLADVFSRNATIFSSWDGKEKTTWLNIMSNAVGNRIFEHSEKLKPKVAVVGNFIDLASGSLIAGSIEKSGIESELFYSYFLKTLDEFPQSWGIVVVGGYLDTGIWELIEPGINSGDYTLMEQVIEEKGLGLIEFDIAGHPGVWIGGLNFPSTVSAVRQWLDSDGVEQYIRRLPNC